MVLHQGNNIYNRIIELKRKGFNMTNKTVLETIDKIIKENEVVLFMKGTPDFPKCGFSAMVVSILQKINKEFFAINVLEDSEMRQGIKDYSDWPTVPQLYINKEFIGGCDIIRELYESGELAEMLKEKQF